MSNGVKEWKSIDEQIGILLSRGMVIDSHDEAKHFLLRVGYYRLSGYWYLFRSFDEETKRRTNNFISGSCFSDITALYNFDRKLRLLALDAIERIELAVQVDIAHLLGRRAPFAHHSAAELHGKFSRAGRGGKSSRYDNWHESYERLLHFNRKKPFVKHNIESYGRLPIWVAVEIMDFGTMSKLFAGMKHKDKQNIESQFGLFNGTDFETWLRSFNFIRNTAAHHGRLWNCNVLEIASVPSTKVKLSPLKNSKPFLYFCLMQHVLSVICPQSTWKEEFIALMGDFPTPANGAVCLDAMGVVKGWRDWPIWK